MKLKILAFGKKKLIAIAAGLVAVILILTWALGACSGKRNEAQTIEFEPYTVSRGDITVSVTGSGTVEPNEQYEIQSIVTGDILEDNVTLGASVNKDDILYVIDSSSAENSIERSEASYEQQVISYNNKLKQHNRDIANRSVLAPVSGYISELYVKNGDRVSAGTKLAEIKNSDYLTVRVPFLSQNAKNIYLNQSATVYIDDRNEAHTGYVSHVATGSYATEAGAIVSDVEITFKNPGALLPGETVTAIVGNFACNDMGKIENSDVEIITAEVSGDVTNLSYSKGDNIAKNKLLLNIYDDSSDSDMRSSELSLKNAKLSLDDLMKKLDDYTVRSPISGTIISKTMKEGDTLDGNKSSLAIVADMSKLTFEMSVDELYIKDISVGQKVMVTADALPSKVFEGVVDTVSIIGSSVSGVTVYPVTVVISEYEGLLPGMNVDAELVISSVSDVLTVPINAISRGNLVMVKENSKKNNSKKEDSTQEVKPSGSKDIGNKQGGKEPSRIPEAPDGYEYVVVETGATNEDFVEIISGLSEGDVIYVTATRNTTSAFNPFTAMGGGMPSGGFNRGTMGSGMPSGGFNRGTMGSGMPSGGFNRGSMNSGMQGGARTR